MISSPFVDGFVIIHAPVSAIVSVSHYQPGSCYLFIYNNHSTVDNPTQTYSISPVRNSSSDTYHTFPDTPFLFHSTSFLLFLQCFSFAISNPLLETTFPVQFIPSHFSWYHLPNYRSICGFLVHKVVPHFFRPSLYASFISSPPSPQSISTNSTFHSSPHCRFSSRYFSFQYHLHDRCPYSFLLHKLPPFELYQQYFIHHHSHYSTNVDIQYWFPYILLRFHRS